MTRKAKPEIPPKPLWTRRQYLKSLLVVDGTNIFLAEEAVATVALEHPEWNMDEKKTWNEWAVLYSLKEKK